jgi:hypothetical protein
MNRAKRKSLIAGEVRSWLPRLLACGLLAFSLAGWSADEPHAVPDLTVHEWGTFTAIAGTDGRAIEWLPLGLPRFPASTDLPKFVEHTSQLFAGRMTGNTEVIQVAEKHLRISDPTIHFFSAWSTAA